MNNNEEMKKLLILLLLIPMVSFGETKLTVKSSCPDWESLISCSDSCKVLNDTEWSFIVNENNQTVLTKTYYKNKSVGIGDNGKCAVVDNNNWVCEVVIGTDNDLKSHKKMIDGKYYNYSTLRGEIFNLGTCGK